MKAETEALLRKAAQSLEAGQLLQERGYYDFAASRAYYAMFYAVEALLRERGLAFSSHSATIAAFGREFAKTGVLDPKFHRYLIGSQIARNEGDYGAGPGISKERAEEVLAWAFEFLTVTRAFLQGS